eukprot:m.24600 g.24600  ORF g.24600 m.24600 type:complete len:1033 (-) comp8724_c0_seq1:97-3195(-)
MILLLLAAACVLGHAAGTPAQVFIVAHTHLDVGWLATFDSYYYLNVSQILPGVVEEMVKDPAKTFVWAEIAYFKRWWDNDASTTQKTQLSSLIASSRFEFVDGGIVQHDQACPTALGIASQMTQGHRFLQATFNVTARIGWSIDPFGSSSSNAWLYSLMKFDALVINRISSDAMSALMANKALEFNWFPTTDGHDSIFTHVFDSYFCMPGGFRWGMNGNNDPDITPDNVQARADELVKQLSPRFAWYRTPNLMVPWGCDFMYQNATRVYSNTDALIAYINAHPERYNMQLRYGTASQYFDAVLAGGLSPFPQRGHQDFFPLVYSNIDHGKRTVQAWSGFYSSRPVLKQLSSFAESRLRAAELLFAIVRINQPAQMPQQGFFDTLFDSIEKARWQSSIVLHHDAITGTGCSGEEGCTGADQMGGDHDVVEDYINLLESSLALSESALAQLLSFILASDPSARPDLRVFSDPEISAVLQQRGTVALVIYNPSPVTRSEVVTLSVPVSWLSVVNATGNQVPAQLVPYSDFAVVLPRGLGSKLSFTLSFKVSVPPLGFSTYFLQYSSPRRSQLVAPLSESASTFRAVVQGDGVEENHEREASAQSVNAPQQAGHGGSNRDRNGEGARFTQQQSEKAESNVNQQRSRPHGHTRARSSKADKTSHSHTHAQRGPNGETIYILNNGVYKIQANNVTGIDLITDLRTGATFSVDLELKYYHSALEDAYSYSVNGPAVPFRSDGTLASVTLVAGPLISELFLFFNEEHGVVVRLYQQGQVNAIELHAGVGVLEENTDVILLVRTNISSQQMLYTDSNGVDIMVRQTNNSLHMEENAWPATSFAFIRDGTNAQLSLALPQVHTVQSLNSGEIQVLLHRRTRFSDVSGAVVLDDTLAHRETLFMTLGATQAANRDLHNAITPPLLTFAAPTPSRAAWISKYWPSEHIPGSLPAPVQLFSLAASDATGSQLLARFRHPYIVNEDSTFSSMVTFDPSFLSHNLVTTSVKSLSFVQTLSPPTPTTNITLGPGDIRSFAFQVKQREV